jgi:hypothetical protein
MADAITHRHPELVSGPISRHKPAVMAAPRMLKRFQHDENLTGVFN